MLREKLDSGEYVEMWLVPKTVTGGLREQLMHKLCRWAVTKRNGL